MTTTPLEPETDPITPTDPDDEPEPQPDPAGPPEVPIKPSHTESGVSWA